MQEFNRIQGNPGVYATDNIQELEISLGTIKKIDEWEKATGLDRLRVKRRRAATRLA
jgi:hypothetical protein